jgi:hypothetical protein
MILNRELVADQAERRPWHGLSAIEAFAVVLLQLTDAGSIDQTRVDESFGVEFAGRIVLTDP